MESNTATAPVEQAKPEIELPAIPPITVERNGVSLPFVIQADTKGLGKGTPFMAPDPEAMPDLATTLKFIDNDGWAQKKVWSFLKKLLKGEFADAYESATGADGVFDLTKFTSKYNAAMAELKFYSETIKELRTRKDLLTSQAVELAASGNPESFAQIQELLAQVSVLARAIEAKGRKAATGDDDGEDDEANKS